MGPTVYLTSSNGERYPLKIARLYISDEPLSVLGELVALGAVLGHPPS